MQIRILGDTGAQDDNGESLNLGKGQSLLQTIAVFIVADGPLPSTALEAILWDDGEVDDPGRAFRSRRSRLRKILGDRIISTARGYGLRLDNRDYVDLRVFRALVRDAEQANRTQDYEVAADLYKAALDLWQGTALLDLLPSTAAMAPIRNSLDLERAQAHEASLEIRLRLGQHQQLARELPELLDAEPLHEDLARLLMIAQHRSGRRDKAVHVFETIRSRLRAEINAEPGTLLQRTHEQILRDDPVLDWKPLPVRDSDKAVLATGADPRKPTHERILNYQTGGKHNLPVDRALVKKVEAVAPNISETPRAHEAFSVRATRFLAKQGIDQYIEFGTGLPTDDSPHRIARRIAMGARVLYVTNEPTIIDYVGHGFTDTLTGIFYNEMREPSEILEHRETGRLINTDEPTAIIFRDALNYIPEHYNPARFIKGIMAAFPAGSYLVLSNGTSEGISQVVAVQLEGLFRDAPRRLVVRTREQIEAMFGDLDLLPPGPGRPPGVVRVDTWGTDAPPLDLSMLALGGVAVKQ